MSTTISTGVAEPRTFSRRRFIRGAGALVVAVGVPQLLFAKRAGAAVNPDMPSLLYEPHEYPIGIGPAAIDPGQLDSWLAVLTDGTVVMKTGKVELGQGTVTATKQVVADELDVAFEKVEHIQSDTWFTANQGYTAGSFSTITENGPAGLRQAAADARAALLGMASQALGVPAARLTVADGVVSANGVFGAAGKTVTYAELLGGKPFDLPMNGKATPKPYTAYKIAGTSVPRDDIPGKMYGTFTFTQDVRVPGMVHAQVVRPPTLDSKLVSIDGFDGGPPAGFLQTVVKNNYVAVVAKTEWAALEAAGLLKVKWDLASLPDFSTYNEALLTKGPSQNQVIQDSKVVGSPVVPAGQDVDAVLAATPASRQVSATYSYPIQMHGAMGTSAATAVVDNASKVATVWSSTQGAYQLRGCLATALGFPIQNVHVIYTQGSGCYGLNKADDVTVDAAVISQAVGKPVRIQYTRAGESKWENFGQPYTTTITAAYDSSSGKAKLSAWRRDAWTTNRGGRPGPPGNMASGILMGFPEEPFEPFTNLQPTEALNFVDNINSAPSYIVPAARLTNHTVQLGFLTGPLRSPNRIQNTFVNESTMDDLAYLAGVDPVQFRLDNLQDPRLIAVIQTAAQMAQWQSRPPASKIGTGRYLTGRGIAAMHYEGRQGYNAAVAQVMVDTKTGKVVVDHVWSAQDCGPAINPDGMRLQAEGCLIQGTSRSLIEELKWNADGIISRDWVTYPVIRFNSVPAFDFQIIDRKNEQAVGAGEVLITNMPAAIGNAIFDATGKRLRTLPFTPARVRAALTA